MTRVLKAVTAISLGTLLSRILGFVRDATQAHVLGASWVNGVFLIAWSLPNLMRRLLGEGALSAAFIPAFTRALDKEGKPSARRLLASVGAVLLAVTGALAAAVVALCFVVPPAALGLEDARAPDGTLLATSEQRGRALLHLTKIVFPYVVPICAAAILTGAQNALGIFGWPALAPALLNVLWVGALLGVMALGIADPMTIATVLAASVLVAGFVQVAPSLVQLARRDCLPRPAWPAPGEPARGVFAATVPTMLGMSMTQFSLLVDQVFAEWFCGAGMTTHLYLANRLLLFPHALTSLALAQAVFPRFARLATREELAGLDAEVSRALHWTFLVTVPASLGLILVSPQLIAVFFVHGQFGAGDAYWTVRTTATLVAGLPFIGVAQLHARALYALGDMRTPALVAALLLVLGIGLNFLLVLGLKLNVAGLTIATSLGAIVNAVLLRRRFRRLCGACATPHRVAVPAVRILGAVAAMCAVVLGLEHWLVVPPAWGRAGRALGGVALPVVLGVGAFGAAHLALGGRELLALKQIFTRSGRNPCTPPPPS